MKINHLNLTVSDVPSAQAFLGTHFGLRLAPGIPASDTAAFLIYDSNTMISLINLRHEDDVSYPGLFHVGFVQDSRADVDALYQRLNDTGFEANTRSKNVCSFPPTGLRRPGIAPSAKPASPRCSPRL